MNSHLPFSKMSPFGAHFVLGWWGIWGLSCVGQDWVLQNNLDKIELNYEAINKKIILKK